MADLDPIVEKSDDPEEHDGHHRQIARPGKPDLGAEVSDRIPEDDPADHGQPSHGRRARLDAVAGRSVFADGLPDALLAQPPQEHRRDQNADP